MRFARSIAEQGHLPAEVLDAAAVTILRLWDMLVAEDATLVEVNPLVRDPQDNIIALEAEFTRIQRDFEALTDQNLARLNRKLTGAGISPIKMKSDGDEEDDADEASANPHAGKADPDALIERQRFPADFRPLH